MLKDVEALSLLPGKKQPVVQYINSDPKAKKAGFVVSPSVLSSEGDGKCAPGRDDCQYLSMKVGDLQKFEYGDKPETYRLELLAIHRKLVPLPDAAG